MLNKKKQISLNTKYNLQLSELYLVFLLLFT